MNETNKNEIAQQMMSFLDFLNQGDKFVDEFQATSFEDVTAETWNDVQMFLVGVRQIIKMQKDALRASGVILNDDAAFEMAQKIASEANLMEG